MRRLLLVATLFLAACSPAPIPTASQGSPLPSLGRLSSHPAPTPSPPSPLAGIIAVEVPPGALGALNDPNGLDLAATWNFFAYVLAQGPDGRRHLERVDTRTSVRNPIPIPLEAGEMLDFFTPIQTDGSWFGLMVWHRLGPPGTGGAP